MSNPKTKKANPSELIFTRKLKNILTLYGKKCGAIKVLPGSNRIKEPDQIEDLLNHKDWNTFIENDVHVVVNDIAKNDEELFSNMTIPKAKKIIESCVSIDQLQEMLGDEVGNKNRGSVLTAINKQIETIKNPSNEDLTKG